MKLKKADVILIAVIFCAALAGLGYWYLTREEGARAVVTRETEEGTVIVADLPLSEDTEMEIEGPDGDRNYLVIRDGAAYITEANCPDRICVESYRSGIRYDGETIICLPHKLVVEIVGGDAPDVDNVVK